MKPVRKWLLPALTCLIVVGAAILPPQVSRLRDLRQFGQVHTEALEADNLPVYEPPSLTDRLELYLRWRDSEWAVPSVRSPEEEREDQAEKLIRAGLERLVEGDVFSADARTLWAERYLPDLHISSWSYVLLWDMEDGVVPQEPCAIWELTAVMDTCTVGLALDAESGLPLYFDIYDSNLVQWISSKDPEALPSMAERFLALLGLEGERVTLSTLDNGMGQCIYRVKGADFYFHFDYTYHQLVVQPEPNNWLTDSN